MADDLVAINIQKIEDSMATAGEMPTGMEAAINEHLNRARAAQASGNDAEAIAITSKVLEQLEEAEKRA
ncbi:MULTISPECIES: hypothetical protein [unclassified Streptomyces]|uniref:hypothetical protein n=1 Tax=unclassified Streptomyces TaxID=2593676 RepID=UPI00225519EA|nr:MULTISPECIES: hypothetical protein [unclassified Streptomyces]MCX5443624.1 hypothetical protein [Streptomyces sp. NBC_00063]WSE12058.1 hypothetical protein OG518_01225 [Streptomyces sp. NBC_01397]WSE19568.1 hypothetical protein OG518_43215 [Streptomyces sp. NBC_01397]WUB99010.1 hypothetical protein OHO83_45735 [Streptomyces sp. NBC_00569]